MDVVEIGWNPGQRFVKDSFTVNGSRKDTRPYPAVIAPWAEADESGLAKASRDLQATVGKAHYVGGRAAERLPLAVRQMSSGRLEADSAMYQALIQMSLQQTGLAKKGKPHLLIATALPVEWCHDEGKEAIKHHIRTGLNGLATIKDIYVQSEPNAVVSSELLDDSGAMVRENTSLAKGLVCVGDLGGGTINISVLDDLAPLRGLSSSPKMGSRWAVEALMQQTGQQYVDAEHRLEQAVQFPGMDAPADALLKQYREAAVAVFQQAWGAFTPTAYLFAGGTLHWVAEDIRRAFSRVRFANKPQQAIAIGLWRYARRKSARS